MPAINLSQIITLISEGKVIWTEHVAARLRERGIRRMDLLECIYNGEIIKQYTDDTPFPSCLILGYYAYNQPLHIVVGVNAGVLCSIITAYRPDINQWESDYKTRKGQ